MKEYRRELLLDRIERVGSAVGVDIPDRITVQGQEVDLNDFVLEVNRLETVPDAERGRVEEMKKQLRRERLQRRQRIENDEVTFEEGEALVESIAGIERALNALEDLGQTDLEEEARREMIEDRRRWISFLRRVQ